MSLCGEGWLVFEKEAEHLHAQFCACMFSGFLFEVEPTGHLAYPPLLLPLIP